MKNNTLKGHLAAIFAVSVWGVTFISTKVLLMTFTPIEILIIRFILGYLTLCILSPHRIKGTTFRQECFFAGAGFSGVVLYYVLENVALTYTQASNVGVIISCAPFLTAICCSLFSKEKETFSRHFVIGFFVAMAGICVISYNGASLSFNPFGDFLTVIAALCWGFYSVFIKEVNSYGYGVASSTRRIFFYGLIGFFFCALITGVHITMDEIFMARNLWNFLFLGIVACALCFVVWNYAVEQLGAVKSSVYIYLDPVITVIASALILHEKITVLSVIGTGLILAGLCLSQKKGEDK